MDKVKLKETLIRTQQETIHRLREDYTNYQSESKLNLDDVREADDNSHREQTEEYLQV